MCRKIPQLNSYILPKFGKKNGVFFEEEGLQPLFLPFLSSAFSKKSHFVTKCQNELFILEERNFSGVNYE